MGRVLMRLVYSLIITLISPFFFLRLLYRSRKAPDYRSRWNERLAIYRSRPAQSGVVWFHAVSFGEAEALFPLIRALQERYPDLPQLVTATTLTGSNRIRSVLGDSVQHVYLPYDLPGTAGRFLGRFKPILGVVVETEIWPNLYRECAVMGIPLAIINARLSEKSARGYRKISSLVRQTLSTVALIAAQAPEDAERFAGIGANRANVLVTGNLKFDYPVPTSIFEQGSLLRRNLFGERPVWIAASTHHGEEEQILDAFATVRTKVPDLVLILVPRRPERFARVKLLSENRGFEVVLRSSGLPCCEFGQLFLLDSMGELKQFYAAADIAFIGGSLVKTGGHNALEAAALGVPVLFGPHMFNFEKIAHSLVKAGAAFQITDRASLARQVSILLDDYDYRKAAGASARAFVEDNRGTLKKLLELFSAYLDTSPEACETLENQMRSSNSKAGPGA
ncbi:MAG: lipid IV(A) 3-deoxy-D-manno-octulosonic acid transferase [Methylococcaceae bacterium]|nr:lipid IV(A) 3-deoxy-D-manno-octulosonic acid transferase [Methylococcaceae bacterium]